MPFGLKVVKCLLPFGGWLSEYIKQSGKQSPTFKTTTFRHGIRLTMLVSRVSHSALWIVQCYCCKVKYLLLRILVLISN